VCVEKRTVLKVDLRSTTLPRTLAPVLNDWSGALLVLVRCGECQKLPEEIDSEIDSVLGLPSTVGRTMPLWLVEDRGALILPIVSFLKGKGLLILARKSGLGFNPDFPIVDIYSAGYVLPLLHSRSVFRFRDDLPEGEKLSDEEFDKFFL
jgi:hypothetical protein